MVLGSSSVAVTYKKVFVNSCASTRLSFILWNKVGNFRGFRVFNFGPYAEIKNSENSEIFLRLLNLSEFPLFEGIGSFRGFRVFDFGSYAEMENLRNSEFFSRLVKLSEFVLF